MKYWKEEWIYMKKILVIKSKERNIGVKQETFKIKKIHEKTHR